MEVPACTDVSALGVSGAVAPVKRRRSGPKSKSSPYIGVTQYKRTGRYEAHIWIVEMRGAKGHQRHLGSYATAEDAARCYDRAALRLRGPGAELNFPLEDYSEDPFLIAHSKVDKFRFLDLLRAEFAIQSDRPSSFAARARAGVSPSARRGAPPAGRGLPGAVRSPMKAAAAPASRMGPLRGAADMGSRRVEGGDWRGTLSSAQTSTPPPYMVTGWYAGGDASGRGSAQASAHVSREAYALGGLEEDLLGSSWNDLGAGWGGADGSGSRAGGWGYHDPSAHVGWRVQGYVGAPRSALERGYTPPESSVGLHPSQLSSLESQTHGGGLYGAGVDGSRAYFMPYGEGLSPSSRAVGYAQNQNTAAGLSQSAPAHYSTGAGSGLGPASGLTQAFGAEGSLDPQPGVPLSPPVLGSSSSAPLSPAGAPYTPVASALHSPPLGSAQGRPLGAVSMPMHSGLGHPSHHPSLPACQPASGALSPPHVLARGGGVEGEGLQSTPLSDQTWISPDGDLRADAARLEDAASHLLGDDPLAYSSLFGPWDHV